MKKRFLCAGLVALLGLGAIGLGACSSEGEEGYSLEITNKEELEADWYLTGSSRTIGVKITKDGEVQNYATAIANGELTVTSSKTSVVAASGLVLTPAGNTGSSKITVEYHGWKDSVNITVTEEPAYTTPWELGKEYFLGIEYNDKTYYATGDVVGTYSYEGELSTSMNEATRVTMSAGDENNEYYMSFVKNDVTYYITIEEVGGYIDLQYETTKSPIYWDGDNEIFVNEDRSYFLCCNTTYMCLYASSISSWFGSSPIATLYEIPDVIPEDEPLAETAEVTSYTSGSSYLLGIDNGTKYYMTGEMSSYYGAVSKDPSEGIYFTITDVTNVTDGVTITATIDGATKYVGMTVSSDHTNLTFADTEQVLTYNSDYNTFTVANGDSSVFIGSRSSYNTIGWYDISNITDNDYYPLHPYSIVG